MKKALVILSGGQDSTTCLFWARQQFEEVYALTFNYGQKHQIELWSAKIVANMAKVANHEILNISKTLKSVSPLLSDTRLNEYADVHTMSREVGNRIENTFVPMRNMLFLTIAANRARFLGCDHIVIGVSSEDTANYPDCTDGFISSLQNVINVSLNYEKPNIQLICPLMFCTKADTVRFAHRLPGAWEALAYTHTSYDGLYPPTGKNHANLLRAQGFLEAGLPDPLVLRAYKEGLMELPDTPNYMEARNDLAS